MRVDMAKPAKACPDIEDKIPRAALEALGEIPVEVLAISEMPDGSEPSTQARKCRKA
jgi:hypothetical protein